MNTFDDALTFHRNRLARLKSIIEEGMDSPYPGVRTASQSLVPERDRLVLLLGAFDGKVDVILPDGSHRYWSTHCRHATDDEGHRACSATTLADTAGNVINRRPSQCRRCAAPCLCSCHKSSTEGVPA